MHYSSLLFPARCSKPAPAQGVRKIVAVSHARHQRRLVMICFGAPRRQPDGGDPSVDELWTILNVGNRSPWQKGRLAQAHAEPTFWRPPCAAPSPTARQLPNRRRANGSDGGSA